MPSTSEAPADPFVGSVLADRYQIQQLINAGGMGRVYRARQQLLDREVAVKVIHPHLLTTEQVVARFLAEARTSSRLNHPNVVNIYDFGRTSEKDGAHLYLVMELLSGKSLASMLEAGEQFSPSRITRILRQVLAALGEAHALGITHRDVKPENVIVDQRRGDPDRVKVIDFGIATATGDPRLSQMGQLLGTPHYMAPEMLTGKVGPSVDLYAVGIVLFELLTGAVPFDEESISEILIKQASAPRPDPRVVAPDKKISDALAEVCLRAIAIDVAERFPTAEQFAEAIEAATAGTSSVPPGEPKGRSVPPRRTPNRISGIGATAMQVEPPSVPAGRQPTPGPVAAPAAQPAAKALSAPPRRPSRATDDLAPVDPGTLVGRDAILRETWHAIRTQPHIAQVLWGPSGVGRTALLTRLSEVARKSGMQVVSVAAAPAPRDEISFLGLQTLVAALIGVPVHDPTLRSLKVTGDDVVSAQLRQLFEMNVGASTSPTTMAERDGSKALRWAAERAVKRANGSPVLLAIDDVDAFDGATRWALDVLLDDPPIAGLCMLLTSENPPDAGPDRRVYGTRVPGLSRVDASTLRTRWSIKTAVDRTDDEIEPLYIEALRGWEPHFGQIPPPTLAALLEWQIRALPAPLRRTLQAVAVLGRGSLAEIRTMVPEVRDSGSALNDLASQNWARVEDGFAWCAHPLFARMAAATAAADWLVTLYGRASNTLAGRPDWVELRAYYAMRAAPDDLAFLLVGQGAEMRLARGDLTGAVALLYEGVQAARMQVLHGETESQAAWSRFAQMLGGALIALDRPMEALGVLDEALAITPPRSTARALLQQQLAIVAMHRGRGAESERWRKEAVATAERCGDAALADRIRAATKPVQTGRHRKPIFSSTNRSLPAPVLLASGGSRDG